ncbi:MAG TPA: DUF3300 domain-containing protein [Terriglobia bacterium]|jgi:hypothetical protein
MKPNILWPGGICRLARPFIGFATVVLLVSGNAPLSAAQAQQQAADETAKIPADQLDALVAPIALYPDQLLSQTLVASTYPLELIQLGQWLGKNKGLTGKPLVDAVSKQPWDPSVQAMAPLPDLVKRLADNIQWTTDLGNAFLAQESDVMDAVQRMRAKAQSSGALTSSTEQKVETQQAGGKSVIVVEQSQPDVVYVPDYNPVAIWGTPAYPYPSLYYPAYTPGVVAAGAISFGVGVAMGAAWGGGWGWNAGWGNGDIDVNRNNTFNRNTNISGNRGARSNVWQHNPQHRGGAPYGNRATANRFGSNARGDSLASRQKGAQQQLARQKGNLGSVRSGAAPGNRPGGGNFGGAGGGAGLANRGGSSGGNRIGNRSVGSGSSRGDRGGFGGGGGFNSGAARANRSRGASSFGGRSGGGGGGGGRARGGGRR